MKVTQDYVGRPAYEYTMDETLALERQRQDFWMAQFSRAFVLIAYVFTLGMGTIIAYKGLGYWVK